MAATLLALGYIVAFLFVFSTILQSADTNLFVALNSLASMPAVAYLAIGVNEFGSELILIPFAGLMYLVSKSRKMETASLIVYSIVISEVVLTILKAVYFRPRPSQTLSSVILPLGPETDSSFPSGHTARAFAVATLTILMRGRKYSFLLALAFGVGISRVVLGVHYPLDVVGGSFLGALIGVLGYETGRRLYSHVISRLFPGRTFS